MTLNEADMIAAAEKTTGLDDWGSDQTFRVGLGKLVIACNEMNAPAEFFEQARTRLTGILATKLHLIDDAKKHPEVLAEKIEQPMVVVGLPRTGTTITYDLLSLDAGARTPRDWEFAMPWPAPQQATWDTDPRIAQLNAVFAQWLAAAPELENMQHFDATNASECNFVFTHHFASVQFPGEWSVPSYQDWLLAAPPAGRYAAHKRILQQLQWKGPRGRWTLKSPEHLFDLDGLLAAYPDASLIWTHRDPVQAFSSLASMLFQFWRAMKADPDKKRAGRCVIETWSRGVEKGMASRAKNPHVESAIIDIPHTDVIKDKVDVIKRIYQRFDLPFNAEYAMRLQGEAAASVSGRLGKHKHNPEDYGIRAEEIREALPKYYARFGHLFKS
jgi:hypothetical protein